MMRIMQELFQKYNIFDKFLTTKNNKNATIKKGGKYERSIFKISTNDKKITNKE